MSALKYDTDFWAAAGETLTKRPPQKPRNALQLRGGVNGGLSVVIKDTMPEEIVETKHQITSFDGEQITVHQFAARDADVATPSPKPAYLYVHGGGLVAGDIDPYSRVLAAKCALATGIQMFAVEYRLAPEFPHPTPAEDVYATLKWLNENGDGGSGKLNVDVGRLGLYGLSAGAGLAVGAALMARDRGLSPPLAKQMLIYPMLDDRTKVEADNPLAGFLTWTNQSNQIAWKAYVGRKIGGAEVSEYAAPARAESVEGLPDTYVDVGGLDMFCAEAVAFAGRIEAAGIPVELHVYPGLPHTFDLYAPEIELTRRARENRLKAAKRL